MRKTFASDDFPEMLAASDTGRAMTFFSYEDKVTKSASEAVGRDIIQQYRPPSHMQGVHLTTMGSEEDYGYNRNADSASRAALQKYHNTFIKHGSVYREHKNKGKPYSIGDIKYETYNKAANRGELILWFDKEKAPDMAKKAAEDKELSWSMSMRLPFDRCSICEKKSRNRSQYCSDLRGHIGKFVPKFNKYAYARNEDDIKFVDISEVAKRADRIASYLRYIGSDDDAMSKAASEELVISGAEWAEQLQEKGAFVNVFEINALTKIAAFDGFAIPEATLRAYATRDLSQAQIDIMRGSDFRALAGELIKRAMILPPRTFAAIVSGVSIDEINKDAYFDSELAEFPEIMEQIVSEEQAPYPEEMATMLAPDSCGCSFCPQKDSIDKLLEGVGDNLGMNNDSVVDRAATTSFVIKTAKIQTENADMWGIVIGAYAHYVTKSAYALSGRVSVPNLSNFMKAIIL